MFLHMSLLDLFSFSLFFFFVLYSLPFYLLYEFTEQNTKEQKDAEDIAGETSDLDTSIPEPTVEATQSKDSLPLSLVTVSETIIEDSFADDFLLDATVEQTRVIRERDDSKKSTAIINVSGSFL